MSMRPAKTATSAVSSPSTAARRTRTSSSYYCVQFRSSSTPPCSGYVSPHFFSPLPRVLTTPQACLIQGALIGWTVLIGVVLAAIFLGPPLFFDEVKTGYMYAGAFVGALLGFVVSGVLADWSARIMTRRNNGIYEPEFRIVLAIPVMIFGCAGLYGFGITSNDVVKYGWFWPDFFFGLEVMGMVIGAVLAALYIVDAHRMFF